ncbi:MAG: HU family DNA-binding protein [Sphingomonas sp.]
MVDQLAKEGRVELGGFGAFWTQARKAGEGPNPRTGETVEAASKRVPRFKAGKGMKDRLLGTVTQ